MEVIFELTTNPGILKIRAIQNPQFPNESTTWRSVVQHRFGMEATARHLRYAHLFNGCKSLDFDIWLGIWSHNERIDGVRAVAPAHHDMAKRNAPQAGTVRLRTWWEVSMRPGNAGPFGGKPHGRLDITISQRMVT
ncbi:hypothetical protein [Burkholderia sp. AU15512]|uniref:hypothetical protein n=1 Tax=Burkholderia sp. AU15512 TaxID=2015345 RepID=UPI0015C65348|nr:hypothetical protein [Burkholderia sp. AU15512]